MCQGQRIAGLERERHAEREEYAPKTEIVV